MKLQEKERKRAEGRTCILHAIRLLAFSGDSDGEESACSAGDQGSIPGLERSPRRREWLFHSSVVVWRILWAKHLVCLFIRLFYFSLFLTVPHSFQDLGSATRGQAQGPSSESVDSSRLDCQGIPYFYIFMRDNWFTVLYEFQLYSPVI